MSASTASRTSTGNMIGRLAFVSVKRFSALWLVVIFIAIFSVTASDTFPTRTTFNLILASQVTVGILALAALIPLTAGAFDLSIGATLALGVALTTKLCADGWSPLWAGLVAVIAGMATGWLNGLVTVKFNVNSFIATLGSSQLLTAAALKITDNKQITPTFPSWFSDATAKDLFGISLDTYYLFAIAAVIWYVLEYTAVGRSLFATGGNQDAARLAGLSTDRLIWGSLIASGGISAFAGVLLASRLGTFSSDIGPGYLFPAFAAVFFGATQIKGRANVWGSLLAMYSLAIGVNGLQLTFFGNDFWINPLFQGGALLVAVVLASWSPVRNGVSRRLRGRSGGDNEPAATNVAVGTDEITSEAQDAPVMTKPKPTPETSRAD